MKKYTLFCLLVFLHLGLYSQTIEEKIALFNKACNESNFENIIKYENDVLKYYYKDDGINEDYINAIANTAFSYYNLGDFKKSIELSELRLNKTEKLFGYKSNYYIVGLSYLASNYYALGEIDIAIELYEKCIDLSNSINDLKSDNYLHYLKSLFKLYSKQEKNEKSLFYILKIVEILKVTHREENEDYLFFLYKLSSIYWDIKDYDKVLGIDLEKLEITKNKLKKNNPEYLKNLQFVAYDYYILGKYNNSKEFYNQALDIYKINNDQNSEDYFTLLSSLSIIYEKLGNLNKSIELITECLTKVKILFGDTHPLYSSSLNNLALNYSKLGNYKKALELYNECLTIKEKIFGIESQNYLTTLNNLVSNYIKLGDYKKAFDLNFECVKINEKILNNKESLNYLITLNNLATNYSKLGNYNKALQINIECLKIREKVFGVESLEYLTILNNLSINYIELGDYIKSLELNNKSLKIQEKIFGIENPSYLTSLNNLGLSYLRLGDYNKSLEINSECLSIREAVLGKESDDYLVSLNNLALTYSELGNYKKALELYNECLTIKEKIFGIENPGYLISLNNLSLNYYKLNDYKKSLELNLENIEISKKLFGSENPNYDKSLENISFNYLRLGKHTLSDSLFLLTSEFKRKNFNKNLNGLNENLKETLKEDVNKYFQMFSNYSIFRKESNPKLLANSFNYCLNLNGIIINQSSQLQEQVYVNQDSSFIHLYEDWKLNKLQLMKYYELTKPELEKRGINIAELEEEINEQERALSRGSEAFSEIKKTYALSDIQQQLKEDEAYVDIVRLPYYNFNTNVWSDTIRYLAYIITKDTKEIPTTVLLENGNQLEEEIASYYAENTFGKSKREKDSISYAYFWKPIYKELSGKRKVYLSSGGVFNNINVQTLFNPSTNKYVSEELEVQLVNNGRTFIQQKTKKPQVYTKNTATLIGYPNFNGTLSKGSINEDAIFATTREFSPMLLDTLSRGANLSPLPGTKKEVETIGELLKIKKWDVNVFTENNASEEEIKKVESPRVLHIATHGYFLKQTDNLQKESGLRIMGMDSKRFVENPLLRSGLLLSGANKTLKGDTTKASENGILTAYEAAYLHLQGTELVVLSACETGKGQLKNGEGVYGLRKSFADAGAKNIIMSLWKVDDKVTQEFMTSFYTNWSTGITIREAFNKTQQSIKALYPQPYYWGAFILVGE